jgi:hypothetical protein
VPSLDFAVEEKIFIDFYMRQISHLAKAVDFFKDLIYAALSEICFRENINAT